MCGGGTDPGESNIMDYVTIGSTGNATDFGNLTGTRVGGAGTSNSTRGVIGGGKDPSTTATIDYITIASAGNGTDFGDLTVARKYLAGCSNGHGGLS